ncbi:kinase-like protein [Xylona heveae TC161]|uniref:ethanolamine kinase n=1 Tax=Xylona heveae (strain CBS 132557 / TC161) TaxID=1328760 RepID=A0A165JQ58_XYLHT|nr:kinase-like protein [Xylona heveae TC161]KZF26504.1 kinase-like protein [Xylona heveae TC161]
MSVTQSPANSHDSLLHIPLTYNIADSQASALRLVLALYPQWEHEEGPIEFVRFTDGITNTLLKAIKKRPGSNQEQIDEEAVLLRAYGKGTDLLIDRERETASHSLLARHGLAPALLARFQNGLLYKFIRGKPCSSEDLTRPSVWRGVARRLAQWHAVLPVVSVNDVATVEATDDEMPLPLPGTRAPRVNKATLSTIQGIAPGKPVPNIWTVMQQWVLALPAGTEAEKQRQATLQRELERIVKELAYLPGPGKNGLVFGHCDLLSGNVIREPCVNGTHSNAEAEPVSFIDYEYATPAPAAFDIANHFAEWGGFDCDYSVLPTSAQRRGFLKEYLESYHEHSGTSGPTEAEVDQIFQDVDLFRGIPGFYWGVWALIQATISQIDFDYASYAEIRLAEYWAWREEAEGTRAKQGKETPLRERRWAQEA